MSSINFILLNMFKEDQPKAVITIDMAEVELRTIAEMFYKGEPDGLHGARLHRLRIHGDGQ